MEKQEKKQSKKQGKSKKILKWVLSIVALIIVAMILYEIVIYSDGYVSKNNYMSRDEVIELLEKGARYPNYYYSAGSNFGGWANKTEYYIKDGIQKILVNGEVFQWRNYNTNEVVNILGEKNGVKYASTLTFEDVEGTTNQYGFDYSLIANAEDYNYKYIGEKKVDGRDAIIVSAWYKDTSELQSTKFYIDKDTGLILKRVDYGKLGFFIVKIVSDRHLRLDVVTDQDVAMPNLEGYEILN